MCCEDDYDFASITARELEIEERQKESLRGTDDHSGWRRGGLREEKEKETTDAKEEGGERSSVWRAGGDIGWAQGMSTQLHCNNLVCYIACMFLTGYGYVLSIIFPFCVKDHVIF